MAWLNYLLEVSVCITVFYALHKLVFVRYTFYRFNRFYLLITLVVSFVIPALSVKIQHKQTAPQSFSKVERLRSTPIQLNEETENIQAKAAIDWVMIITVAYVFVAVIFCIVFLWQLILLVVYCRGTGQKQNGMTLIEKHRGHVNFSFFHYVFVDKKSICPESFYIFLKHEKFHAGQLHSLDRLLVSIGKIVLWFNPIIYFYSRELSLQHEFETDEFVSGHCGKKEYADVLLGTVIKQSQLFNLTNAFAKKPVSLRIQKIFTQSTSNMKKSFYVSVLPVMALLCWLYSYEPVYAPAVNSAEKFTIVIDAGHGGGDWGAVSNGIYEKDITLKYAKALSEKLQKKNIQVIMTRTGDELVLLDDRSKHEADLLLSLHVNTNRNEPGKNGILMLVPSYLDKNISNQRIKHSVDMTCLLNQSFKGLDAIKLDSIPYHNQKLRVLERSKSSAILLELGFMSNPKDFKYITSTKGQEEITDALTNAVIAYRNNQASSH